ncbi:hypothetical protein MC45_10870 [Sphingomonas taxi]|uniref:Uncharacterized protein n=1 Tax=Sphingomonas taxi TaxID=1549858 RepID=A0A097EGT7_9SPHN|nr:hypothetical protein MC45_10870 [Sphingomonas taxi]
MDTVTLDLFRVHRAASVTAALPAILLAARWTPEQVRGDGVGLAPLRPIQYGLAQERNRTF